MCGVLACFAKTVLWVLRMLWYFISFEETPSLSTSKHRLRDLGSMLQGRENKCLQVLLLHLLKQHHMLNGTDFCTQLEEVLAQNGERSECETQADTRDNFNRVLQVLSLLSVHIKMLCQTDSENLCKWFSLGDAGTLCLGYAVYDAKQGHVYLLEGSDLESFFFKFPAMEVPSNFSAGGKKRACPCKCDDKVENHTTSSSSLTAEDEERIRHLVAIARTPNINYRNCMARVYQSGRQCGRLKTAGFDFCTLHLNATLVQKHGRIDNPLEPEELRKRILFALRLEKTKHSQMVHSVRLLVALCLSKTSPERLRADRR